MSCGRVGGGEVPLNTQHLRQGTATELSDPAGTLEMPIDAHFIRRLKTFADPQSADKMSVVVS